MRAIGLKKIAFGGKRREMIEVNISSLEGEEKEELPGFIEEKLPVESEREGDNITFRDKSERRVVKASEIKTYLKRFLHQKKLRNKYRILSEGGVLTFFKIVGGSEEEKEAKSGKKGK